MNELAACFRFMQLYAHMMHNVCYGDTFMQDHAHFGDLYPAYESAYDGLIERMIGLGESPDIIKINKDAFEELSNYSEASNDDGFKTILDYEKAVCAQVEKIKDLGSEGTKQMLGDLANQSEIRQYKLNQRLKGE